MIDESRTVVRSAPARGRLIDRLIERGASAAEIRRIVGTGAAAWRGWPPVEVEIVDTANPFLLVLHMGHMGKDAPLVGLTVLAEKDEALDLGVIAEQYVGADCEAVKRAAGADLASVDLEPASVIRLARNLDSYVKYARAEIAWERGDAMAAADAVRSAGSTPRGRPDKQLRKDAAEYLRLCASGDRHPYATMAKAYSPPYHRSRPKRWIEKAQRRASELGVTLQEFADGANDG